MAAISDEYRIFVSTKMKSTKPSLVNWDKCHHISALAYIFQYDPKLLLPHELERLLIDTYECLKEMDMLQPLNNILILLETMEKERYIYLDDQYKIFIRNRWFCKLMVLSALKFHKLLFTSNYCLAKKTILQQAIRTFRPDKPESLYLLQLIVKLTDCPVDFELESNLITFVRIVAYSPLKGFKQFAEIISKNIIRHSKSSQLKEVLEIDFVPLRGIATSDLEPVLITLNFTGSQIVTRIIEMFSNNIENRDGSFLYRILLKSIVIRDDFDAWKDTVWPQFYKKFQAIDYDGEFFQSLLKYWIPISVMTYKTKLHEFIRGTHIPALIKGHVLLETRRRSLVKAFDGQDVLFLENLFSHAESRKLAFQVVGCPVKKGALPSLNVMVFVGRYLFEQSHAWSREEALAFNQFLIQIAVAVADVHVDEEHFTQLRMILVSMLKYGTSLLKTARRHLGAQIMLAFYNNFMNNVNRVALEVTLGDELFQLLKHNMRSEKFVELIELAVLESSEYCPELMDLAMETVEAPKVVTNDFLMDFINESCSALSIKVSDSVKITSRFIARRTGPDNIRILHSRICEALMEASFDWSIDKNPTIVFKVGLLFDALNQISCYVPNDVSKQEVLKRICSVCFPVAASMMNREYYQPKDLPNVPGLSARNKIEKIVESLYNGLCEYLLQNTSALPEENKVKLMGTLVEVIEHSSMRRPTVLSADLLKALLMSTNEQEVEEERRKLNGHDSTSDEFIVSGWNNHSLANYKVNLLNETLEKLDRVALIQTLTIRKNPETRLVLHALCASDASPQKYCLTWTLNCLLKTLSSNASSDATTAAALHCTEILMSDNTLYNYTLKYAPAVIIESVHHFENRNWIVRNASMQLAKALVDRFLGVQIGRNNRPKSVDVLFHLFPQLIVPFHRTVTGERLTDAAAAVMQFFFESHRKNEVFAAGISEVFAGAFAVLIRQNAGFYGLFAVRAYVALCLNRDIPHIVEHIVEFVVGNFEFIRKQHTVRNFLFLVQELYDKYLDYVAEKAVKPAGYYRIHDSFAQLTAFLRHFDKRQFDFLLIKVDTLEKVMATLKLEHAPNDFHHRLWLHNNVPFLLINTPLDSLAVALSEILSKNVPEFLQVKLLSIIVDRFTKEAEFCNALGDIIVVLCGKALRIGEPKQYNTLMCYYKVILLLHEDHRSAPINLASLLTQVRQIYDAPPTNPYETLVCLLILSHVNVKSQSDKNFIKSALKLYQNPNILDEDLAENLSESLKYFYKNCECPCDKRQILKLALLMLIGHGRWHFVTFIVESAITSPIGALHNILDFRFLKSFLGSDGAAFEFVKDFYLGVSRDKPSEDSWETFYGEEDRAYVDVDSIGRAVMRFLVEFCKVNEMDEVRGVNKVNKLFI